MTACVCVQPELPPAEEDAPANAETGETTGAPPTADAAGSADGAGAGADDAGAGTGDGDDGPASADTATHDVAAPASEQRTLNQAVLEALQGLLGAAVPAPAVEDADAPVAGGEEGSAVASAAPMAGNPSAPAAGGLLSMLQQFVVAQDDAEEGHVDLVDDSSFDDISDDDSVIES